MGAADVVLIGTIPKATETWPGLSEPVRAAVARAVDAVDRPYCATAASEPVPRVGRRLRNALVGDRRRSFVRFAPDRRGSVPSL